MKQIGERQRRKTTPAATRAPGRVACMTALLLTLSDGVASARQSSPQEVVPGVWNYDVVLPDFDSAGGVDNNGQNGARDISNGGLVVGRVNLGSGAGVQRAFVYALPGFATSGQFGVLPNAVLLLPNPNDGNGVPFASAQALDINETGVVVGVAGGTFTLAPVGESAWGSRAVLWRLGAGAGGATTWQRFDPPNAAPHGTWPQGEIGETTFLAISSEHPIRAIGWAAAAYNCFGPCTAPGAAGKFVAFVVDVSSTGAIQYRTEPSARPGLPTCPRKARVIGISREGQFMVGSRNTLIGCMHDPVTPLAECTPTLWTPGTNLNDINVSSSHGNLGDAVQLSAWTWDAAECNAVSKRNDGKGLGVGFALQGAGTSVPHAWLIPAPGTTGPTTPLALPSLPDGATVLDVEIAKWLTPTTSEARRIAVGVAGADLPLSQDQSGAIWFWNASGWNSGSWSVRDVNTAAVLSPLWAARGIKILRLRGVNEWGDAVGEAFVNGVRRPVILRASRLLGDLDWNGCVGASDLAILLSAWCPSAPCNTATPAADFNRDGLVGAQDLATMLSQWSCTQAALESPVPASVAQNSRESVDFAANFVGLSDIPGYRAWAATAPEPLRALVDSVMWSVAKGGQ